MWTGYDPCAHAATGGAGDRIDWNKLERLHTNRFVGSINYIDYRCIETREDEGLMEGERRSHLCL